MRITSAEIIEEVIIQSIFGKMILDYTSMKC